MEERKQKRKVAPRSNGKGRSSNFKNKRNETDGRPFIERKPKIEQPEPKFSLGDEKAICSFVVLSGCDVSVVVASIDIIKNSAETIVIWVPSNNDTTIEAIENIKSEKIVVQKYTNESETDLHNRVFDEYSSDIFIVTNSNVQPRPYALNILKKYLFHDSSVITVPTVYNTNTHILHYCLRFPKLISYIKILCGVKSEKQRLVMMERGENGYYRIHRVDASKSQLMVINSNALRSIGGKLSVCSDSTVKSLDFYKRILKSGGITLFVPTARIIEHSKATPKGSIASWLCYIMRNVF